MIIKQNPTPTWNDNWVDKSPAPITEMFYRCIGRSPTKDELELYVQLIILPDKNWYNTNKKLYKLIIKNEKKRRRKITNQLLSNKKLFDRRVL